MMTDDQMTTLMEERAALIGDARKLLDTADEEKRELTAEERQQYDTMLEDAGKKKSRIEDEERQRSEEAALEGARTRQEEAEKRQRDRAQPFGEDRQSGSSDPHEFRYELTQRRGEERSIHWASDAPTSTPEYRQAFGRYLKGELSKDEERALSATVQTEGGALTPDMQFVNQLIKFVDDMVFVRQFATVLMVPSADSLGAPSLDADPGDADWTTELATGTEDSTMAFGRRELAPSPCAKRIKVSKTLVRKMPTVDSLVRERLAYKLGITQEKAYMTGTGSNQPLGLFTASSKGISTSRDEAGSNTTTAIAADTLRDCKYGLKPQYRDRASTRWLFHRDAVKMISKLKDSQNQYLWQPGIAFGDPDTILSIPVLESEYAPNTFTASQYVGLLGDLSQYWIADSLGMTIQVVQELYAETNQNGYILRHEGDGMPALEEAFVRMQLAAS